LIKHNFAIVFSTICLCFSTIGAVATEHEGKEAHDAEEEHAKHTLGLFAGATREDGEYHETLGIEYSYRYTQSWSFGGVIERADREKNSTLAIVFAHWWPYKEWFIGAGVGRKDPGNDRKNTFRASIGYEFELGGGWVIEPQANLDIIEGHENEEVYGIAIGKQF
jgi:hypothetical protein